MTPAPERIVERLVKVYDVERQCTAPHCGKWFVPRLERQRWCSKLCGVRAWRAGLSFPVKHSIPD